MTQRNGRHGFTLIELLVVISIIALLISILLPSLTAARQEGIRLKCVANLKTIGQSAQNHGLSSSKGVIHAQSTSGKEAWRGLGGWDFGGSDGFCGEASSRWPASPFNLGVMTRPYNIAASGGANIAPSSTYPEYQCPADQGAANIDPNYVPRYFDPAPCSIAEGEVLYESMYKAMGTSYQGDFIHYGATENGVQVSKRFGSFLLPTSKMKAASELLLFYETRFAQQFLATREAVESDGAFGGVQLDIPGWHGKLNEFSVSFCDGSARKVVLQSQGGAVDVLTAFDPNVYCARSTMYRGNGTSWRYDNFPYNDCGNTLRDWVTEYGREPAGYESD